MKMGGARDERHARSPPGDVYAAPTNSRQSPQATKYEPLPPRGEDRGRDRIGRLQPALPTRPPRGRVPRAGADRRGQRAARAGVGDWVGAPVCTHLRVLDEMERCTPRGEREHVARFVRAQREQLASTDSIDAETKHWRARDCALAAGDAVDDAMALGCAIGLTRDERAVITGERTRRTAAPSAGSPADQALLRAMATLRDRMCACAEAVDADWNTAIRRLEGHSDVVPCALDRILAESSRCLVQASMGRRAATIAPGGPTLASVPDLPPRLLPVDAAVAPPPPVVEFVTLADGSLLRRADCASHYPSDGGRDCRAMFAYLAECLADARGDRNSATECEGGAHRVLPGAGRGRGGRRGRLTARRRDASLADRAGSLPLPPSRRHTIRGSR